MMFANRLVRVTMFLQLAFLWGSHPSVALDEANVKRILERPIIGSETTLAETQLFTERRVPRMPGVSSADEWTRVATAIRTEVLDNVVYRGEAARWRELETDVQRLEKLDEHPSYTITKLKYEAVPGMWIPALLYEPKELTGKVPVILNVNGHDRADGKAADYKQIRCINQAKRGMIALNVEWVGMGQLNLPGMSHYAMNQLDLCGTSGMAPFYLSMKRGLDVLLEHPHADPRRVGVAGLSGGGWQTVFISALDTRVTLSNPVAGYSSFITRARHFKDLGDSEQTPNDLAVFADYTHLTAMIAPRAGLLTYNQTDNCCFEATYALEPLIEAARPIYKLFGQDRRLQSHVNVDPGTHNFGQDNRQALYAMIRDHFFAGDASFQVTEIECEAELKTKSELTITIPEDNATFNSLAIQLAKSLPRAPGLPRELSAAKQWQRRGRTELNEIIRSDLARYGVVSLEQDSFTREGVLVRYWRIKVGSEWTVPVTEITPPGAVATTMVINDDGRANSAALVSQLIAEKQRVLAVDPFYFGESKVSQRDFLFAFMIATVGHRPLGVQANQVAAVARWSQEHMPDHQVTVMAIGARTSLIALVAVAIELEAIAGVELHGSLGSLKETIENNQLANQTPEVFCFGLLEQFDVLQLAALAAPRPVVFHDPSPRVHAELKPLSKWYQAFGRDHDPLKTE